MEVAISKDNLKSVKNLGLKIVSGETRGRTKYVRFQTREGYLGYVSLPHLVNGSFYIFNMYNPYFIKNLILWIKLNKKTFFLCEGNSYLEPGQKFKFHCNICEEDFFSTWSHISRGHGCGVCNGKQVGKKTSVLYLFPELASEWSKKNKKKASGFNPGSCKKAIWECSICKNEWIARIASRCKQGNGCPQCSTSRGEKEISKTLDKFNLSYEYEKRFEGCKYKKVLSFDFYISDLNTVIEYQGEQHYRPLKIFGGEKMFEIRKKRDCIKKEYCKKNKIKLISISYKNFKEIEQILVKKMGLIK